jgi:uncharacterized surface protein with fasciclin (FAS1) repeats
LPILRSTKQFIGNGDEITRKLKLLRALILTILAVLIILFASGCAQKGANETGGRGSNVSENATTVGKNDINIVQILSDDKYVTPVKLINASGLNETLAKSGPYTIFAPTDKAFNALPTGTIDALMNNKTKLRRVLSYHLTSGELMEQELANMTSFQTLEGGALPVNNTTEGLKVGGAKITDTQPTQQWDNLSNR